MKPDTINNFKAPSPTNSELKLRYILRSKKILFKDSQVIWYTGCDAYTPDFIVGKTLIVEVDGNIHDEEYRKTPDRIRHRALENMGYDVLRVRNEEIQVTPDAVAERIIQRCFEVADNDDRRPTKITKLALPIFFLKILLSDGFGLAIVKFIFDSFNRKGSSILL